MANAFNLTAQINLRGPSNIKPIIGQIRRELGTLKADIKLNIDKTAVKSVDAIRGRVDALNKSLIQSKSHVRDLSASFKDLQSSLSVTKNVNIGGDKGLASTASAAKAAAKNLKESTTAIENFGKQSALALKRFAAFSIVTSGIYALINAVTSGVKAFIEFDRVLVQLQQVTGSGAVGIGSLEKEITNLATSLGVSSAGLAQVAITLAQAGLSADETRIALSALAKTELAPSFDNITDTTEGAIAALRQFGLQAKDLEAALGSINAVAAAFAVESSDIIAAIQRTGGVFASASKGVSEGKDALNEFIAVFTSIRATTRESAETIATGLRTIFTRIQRAGTIEQLKEFGVNLQDLEGKFVGPFEATKRLSEALNQLDPRDIRFATITEELGGFRQIGKVIPLIQQFATAQDALKIAQQGTGSLAEDQAIAQRSLANQIAKVREQFLALIRDVGKSTTFQVITKTVLSLTSGLISLAGAFKPILPILGILGAVKGFSAITQFASGFFGMAGKGGGAPDTGTEAVAQAERERADATTKASDVIRENTSALSALTGAIQNLENTIKSRPVSPTPGTTLNSGGKVLGFARGGVVPGSGNRDTVPAVLTPGEFVIRKKAVETIGANNLQKMNKYASGGIVEPVKYGFGGQILQQDSFGAAVLKGQKTLKDNITLSNVLPSIKNTEYVSKIKQNWPEGKTFNLVRQPLSKDVYPKFAEAIDSGLVAGVNRAIQNIQEIFAEKGVPIEVSAISRQYKANFLSGINSASRGNLFEEVIKNIQTAGVYSADNPSRPFDFTSGIGRADEIFDQLKGIQFIDAKASIDAASVPEMSKKLGNTIAEDNDLPGGEFGEVSLLDKIKRKVQERRQELLNVSRKTNNRLDILNIRNALGTSTYQLKDLVEAGIIRKVSSQFYSLTPAFEENTFALGGLVKKFARGGIVNAPMIDDILQTTGSVLPKPSAVEELIKAGGGAVDVDRTLKRTIGDKAYANAPSTDAQKEVLERFFADESARLQDIKSAPLTAFGQSLKEAIKSGQLSASKVSIISKSRRTRGVPEYLSQLFGIPVENMIFTQGGTKQPAIDAIRSKGPRVDRVARFAQGGSAEDTVPALLTPGEFVINKKAAQKIGYGKLKQLNHADKAQGFNKGGVVGFANGGSVLPSDTDRTLKKLQDILRTAQITGNTKSTDRLEELIGNVAIGTTKTSDAMFEAANIIAQLSKNTDRNDSEQISTLNSLLDAIKATGDFQTAAIEKQTQAIEQQLGSNRQSRTIVGRFPPVEPAAVSEAIPKDMDISEVIENIAQAAFVAGKGLEEFVTDIENFYSTTKQAEIAKRVLVSQDPTKPLSQQQITGATLKAGLATEDYANVDLGKFLNFDQLSSAIKEEIAARKASQQAIEDEKTKRDKAAEEYRNRRENNAYDEFGQIGAARPAQALAFKQQKLIGNFTGGDLLSKAQSFQKGPKLLQGFTSVLDKLPTPLGNTVRLMGGLPGILSATASAVGSNLLPQLGKLLGVSSDPTFAGVSGALTEGGSMAASLGVLGGQLAGPIGAMIGTIGGAVSGAISGFVKGFRTQTLENSLNNLNKNILAASRSLEKLSKVDTAENANAARDAVGKLTSNITDLGQQAQRTGGERAVDFAVGAAYGAGYGGIAAAGVAVASAAAAVPTIAAAVPAIAAIGGALAPLTGGLSLAAATGIIAVGAAIGGITAALSGPDELDKEALQAQLKSIEEYVSGIDQLGQRRLKTKSFEEVDKFLTDLGNAKTPEQKAQLGARTARVQEAQTIALRGKGFKIKDNEDVPKFLDSLTGSARRSAAATAEAAKRSYLLALGTDEINKQYKGNDAKITEVLKNEEEVLRIGEKRNLQLEEEGAKQQKVALAIKQVEQRLQGMLDVFKNITAGIKRFSEESEQYISDVDANVSNLLGSGQLRNVNRENERILANPMAYSEAEVRRAGAAAGGLAGGGQEGAQIGNLALASKLIEERLPALLRGTEQGNIEPALKEIKKYFEEAGIDPNSDAFREIFSQIRTSLEQAAGGGKGATLGELGLADELVGKISKILESGREVALNIQKEYNDTLQRTIDLQNKANALILKANEYRRKADQIRLNAEIQLSEKLGETLTLDQLNAPIATNINSLTQGLIRGGSQDPAQIAQAIIDSQARIAQREEALTRSRNMVGLVGGADTQAGRDLIARNDAEQKAIAEKIRKTQEANQALEALANSGDQAANALQVFDQMQAKINAGTDFLTKLFTADTAELDQMVVQQAALNKALSGTATREDFRRTDFRQQAFGALQGIQGMLTPAEFRRNLARLQRQSMEATAPGMLQQSSGITDSKGNPLTWDDFFKRAENPEDSPELQAYKEASARQAEAANMMAKVNEAAAQQYMSASDKIITFFQNEFQNIVRDAFAKVREIESSARTATTEKPVQTAEVSATEKSLKAAEQQAASSQRKAEQATAKRKEAERTFLGIPVRQGGGASERIAERDAIAQAKADAEEVKRLKAQVEAERKAAEDKAAAAQAEAKAKKEAEIVAQKQADIVAPSPSSRMEQTGLSAQTAQNQTTASQNLDSASTSLNESATNLNNAVAMVTSGGTAATQANIPAARATVAAATTVQNREEIQQQLFVMLDDSTKTFLNEFNSSLGSTFTTFGNNFDKYISRLEQIKLPEKIEMVGRHTVDVRVTGAAGFESLQEGMKNMIAQAIKEKMAMIWNQSDGAYGERPA